MGYGLVVEAGAAKLAALGRCVPRWSRASFYRRDHITDGSDFRACSRATSLQAKLERDAERRRARFDRGRATPTHAWRAGRAGSRVGAGIAGGRGIDDQELLAIAECRPRL